MAATAYIGIGSNLEDSLAHVRVGIAALNSLPRTRVTICSPFYRTAPIDAEGQSDFINAVCVIETDLPALELMRHLLEIERNRGRVRTTRNAARTLDLDLLLYGVQTAASKELTLPHPRMHERAFVLAPLADIAPQLIVPGRGVVAELLRACKGQRVHRMEN